MAERPAPTAIDGMSLLSTADQQEEAAAIAMVLREALETPGATAALVTPDRDLAGRVATELLRYGVVADDSAGEPLAGLPPAVFLRLLARAVAEELAPVPLLALLKHPLAAAGLAPAACRAAARALELACLRGPRPQPGWLGLRRAVDRGARGDRASACWSGSKRCLEPALRIDAAVEVAPAVAMAALIEAAERLAATDELPGPSRLWAGEEGEALATRLAEVQAALPLLPDQRRDVLPGLLDAVLEGAVVRSRRALRGRERHRASARVHLGSAGGAAADRGRDGAGRARRGRVAAGERSRGRGCRGRCARRSGCRRRRRSSASRRTTSWPAPAPRADRGAVLPAAAGRRAGGAGALAHPAGDVAGRAGDGACRGIRPPPGCVRWTSRRMGRGRCGRRGPARRSLCGRAGCR